MGLFGASAGGNGGIWGMGSCHLNIQKRSDGKRNRTSGNSKSSSSVEATGGTAGKRFPLKQAATAANLALTGDTIAQKAVATQTFFPYNNHFNYELVAPLPISVSEHEEDILHDNNSQPLSAAQPSTESCIARDNNSLPLAISPEIDTQRLAHNLIATPATPRRSNRQKTTPHWLQDFVTNFSHSDNIQSDIQPDSQPSVASHSSHSNLMYQFLDHSMRKQTVENLLMKVLLNQIVLGPTVIAVVFAWSNLWKGKLAELPNKYKKDALPTLFCSCCESGIAAAAAANQPTTTLLGYVGGLLRRRGCGGLLLLAVGGGGWLVVVVVVGCWSIVVGVGGSIVVGWRWWLWLAVCGGGSIVGWWWWLWLAVGLLLLGLVDLLLFAGGGGCGWLLVLYQETETLEMTFHFNLQDCPPSSPRCFHVHGLNILELLLVLNSEQVNAAELISMDAYVIV
ncbi:unnamed protein product [Fraxinus pennsylvanica]|uniref:Uncharacterized protein n=1 Tax=Fraxinus pennsylvanica TaxID=56036 RepID=A0AAD1YQY8_9LAMI|nr:unnamed protein product [Fraxinus pennsylvanica]